MNAHELIAQQQLEIAELKDRLEACRISFCDISNLLYGIGGPLNDNKKQYTDIQKVDFLRIDAAVARSGVEL